DDHFKWGRRIHGVDVLGGLEQLETLLGEQQITGLIVTASVRDAGAHAARALAVCRSRGVWVRELRMEFDLLP
ncbi:MAG: hypothetical protein GY796_11665, partial [Chloroflexi bacterium]|nr:hypothetical protein [Chloroflexota bacterium]